MFNKLINHRSKFIVSTFAVLALGACTPEALRSKAGSTASASASDPLDAIANSEIITNAVETLSPSSAETSGSSVATGEAAADIVPVLEDSTFVPKQTNLPIIYIETEGKKPVDSKDDYVNASLKIDPNAGDSAAIVEASFKIKGRGNTTWTMAKKPYKLKFDSKTSLLGMPADKEWALLANYADKTLMRNQVAFELSQRLGLAYTPRTKSVELFLNGEYLGSYLLSETIKVAKSRVNISELEEGDVSASKITGGYLLEIDARLDADFTFVTAKEVPFAIKSPDPIAAEQFAYIKNYIQETENAIFSDSFADPEKGYAKYINVDSFINWFLVNEILKNGDAKFFSSVWMYKDRSQKLSMGPVWDFDIAAGNINYNGGDNPEGWWVKDASWFARMFADPVFMQLVKDRWRAIKSSQLDSLPTFIDQTAASLELAQTNNFSRWLILNSYVWPNPAIFGSYAGEVGYLKDWLKKRIAWLDTQLQ